MAHERLTEGGWAPHPGLAAGDPACEVGAAYRARELLREVYATTSERQARRRLERFYAHCHDAEVVELRRLAAATVRRWEHQILGWHRTGLSNGPTEAMKLLIEKIKRVGHGFRNLENYRIRQLLHCGVKWATLDPSHESEAANHAWSRRALIPSRSCWGSPKGRG